MKKLAGILKRFAKDENGITTAEWVILASAITLAAAFVIGLIMGKVKTLGQSIGDSIKAPTSD